MYEILLVVLIYLLGAELWWLVGVAVLLNKFIKRPILILAIFSPFFWVKSLHELPKIFLIRIFDEVRFTILDQILFYVVGLVICFFIYYLIRKIFLLVDKKAKHPLPFMMVFYGLLFFTNNWLKYYSYSIYLEALRTLIIIFFSNAFVMIVYELHNVRKKNQLNSFQSFTLLNTLHSTFTYQGGTQLSPKGTKHLQDSLVEESELKSLQLKALKVLGLCLGLKVGADILGHLFLNFEMAYLKKISLPKYNIVDLSVFKTIPRFYLMDQVQHHGNIYLAVFIRSIHWLALRINGWNTKIALLWFLGIYIELGILNPFKSSSFVDFFRRLHVYIADFYKVFVYPYTYSFFKFVHNPVIKKYLSMWCMIFLGGLVFQTVSHFYQLYSWTTHKFLIVLETRAFYDGVLATIVCLSLYLEKKKINPNNRFVFIRTIIYIEIYSLIVSMSASMKNENFNIYSIYSYFKLLMGIN